MNLLKHVHMLFRNRSMPPTISPEKIKALALSAMPAGMAVAQSELSDIDRRRGDLCTKIAAEREGFGDGATSINPGFKQISQQQRIDSAERLRKLKRRTRGPSDYRYVDPCDDALV